MKKVTKHTRAKKNGTVIYCPECNKGSKVYHFAWTALTCNHCDTMIEKLDWLSKERQYRSTQGRNPVKNQETYKLLAFTAIVFLISIATCLILH